MERKMLETLLNWKQTKDRMPLILYGARQVGKTYICLSFGKENYKNVVYFNLEGNKDLIFSYLFQIITLTKFRLICIA